MLRKLMRSSDIEKSILHWSFFLLPVGLVLIPGSYSLVLGICFIGALYNWKTVAEGWSSDAGIVAKGLLIPLLGVLPSLINVDDGDYALRRLEKFFIIAATGPVILYICSQRVSLANTFIRGMIPGGFLAFAVAAYQSWYMQIGRVKGFTHHPIQFGDITALFAVLSLVAGGGATETRKRYLCFLSALAWICASYLSGTRGAWLILPVAPVIYGIVHAVRFGISWKKGVSVLAISLLIVSAGGYVVKDRFGLVFKEIERFQNGQTLTSVGQRLVMWDTAFSLFVRYPVVGTGLGDFQSEIRRAIEEGDKRFIKPWGHAHNIYLEHLAMTGVVGFVSVVIGLLVLPLRFFYKKLKQEKNINSVAGGIIVITSFAIFGLTEYWIGRNILLSTYLLTLAVYMSKVQNYE